MPPAWRKGPFFMQKAGPATAGFHRLLLAAAVTRFGSGFFSISITWLLYERTHSLFVLGALWGSYMALGGLFQVVVTPYRLERPRPMVWLAVAAGILLLAPSLAASMAMFRVWELCPVFVAVGLVARPLNAGVLSLVPAFVEPNHRHRANAILVAVTEAAAVVGPVVAGIVIGRGGSLLGLEIDAVGFLTTALLLATLPRMPQPTIGLRVGHLAAMAKGVRRLWSHRRVRWLVSLAVVAEFTDSAYAVLSVPLVILVLHQTPAGLGLLEGALSAGLVVGSGVVRHTPRNILTYWRWWTVACFCSLYAILTTVPSLSWMILIQVTAGVTLAIFQVESQTALQTLAEGDSLGNLLMWQEGVSRGGAKSLGSMGVALLAIQAGLPGAFVVFGILGTLLSLYPALGLRRQDVTAQDTGCPRGP